MYGGRNILLDVAGHLKVISRIFYIYSKGSSVVSSKL